MAYRGIADLYRAAGRFDEAARWARAFYRAHPEAGGALFAYSEALDMLGAWDEQRDLVDGIGLPPSADTQWRLGKLRANVVVGVATRNCPRVIKAIDSFGHPFPAAGGPWSDARNTMFGEAAVLARSFCEWIEGRPESALVMLQAGVPDWDQLRANAVNSWEFRAPVLASALLKASGRAAEANRILTAFLDQARDLPVVGDEGIGFGRFFALAVAGQTRQALDELEVAIDSGWTNLWWTLDLLDADPEFAAVTADPRFREITGRLHDRIAAMRASYRAHPELPEGYSIP
jgi:tetratricopeptide (TPR) repeat protein